VFVGRLEGKVAALELVRDLGETTVELPTLLLVQNAEPLQRPDVGARLAHVMGRQPAVEIDGTVETPESRVGGLVKAGHSQKRLSRLAADEAASPRRLPGRAANAAVPITTQAPLRAPSRHAPRRPLSSRGRRAAPA